MWKLRIGKYGNMEIWKKGNMEIFEQFDDFFDGILVFQRLIHLIFEE